VLEPFYECAAKDLFSLQCRVTSSSGSLANSEGRSSFNVINHGDLILGRKTYDQISAESYKRGSGVYHVKIRRAACRCNEENKRSRWVGPPRGDEKSHWIEPPIRQFTPAWACNLSGEKFPDKTLYAASFTTEFRWHPNSVFRLYSGFEN
jgi:hypothetical protein